MLDLLLDLLSDVLLFTPFRGRDGRVHALWVFLGMIVALAVVTALFFGFLFLIGVH